MRKYAVEFIGTFFLVFTIGNVVIIPSAGDLAPLAIGAVLIALVFAGGHISGAHYNPAVTMAMAMRGKCESKDIGPYFGAQILGAALAANSVLYLKGPNLDLQPMDLSAKLVQALLAEGLFTFALVYVILNVATAKGTEGNSYYGLAIGLTVMAGAFAVGGITGAVFNPAVAVGISLMGLSSWTNIWVYLVANFAAAAIAAVVFKFLSEAE